MDAFTTDQHKVELAKANAILANEGVLDVFGHVSARHPERPDRFFLSSAKSPERVTPGDLLEFSLDSQLVSRSAAELYSERVIHGCIYGRRDDVNAVCHMHAIDIMPFCITEMQIDPISHVGATIGARVPVWSSQAAFGDTNMLVSTPEQGQSLAEALADEWVVLMRNHGAVVVGRNIAEVVFRSIHLRQNARIILDSLKLGPLIKLTENEIKLSAEANLSERILARAWDYWNSRLNYRI